MSVATWPRPKSKVKFNEDGDPILPPGAEYVDGRILQKSVSELSAWVSAELQYSLHSYLKKAPIGLIFNGSSEQGFQCFPHQPKQIRRPDAAFVRRALMGDFLSTKGYTKDVPELIAEVLSPDDRMMDVNRRISDFRKAGTKLLWIIDPLERTAKIIHPDGIEIPIDESGILSGEDVLPGFTLPLSSILPPKMQK